MYVAGCSPCLSSVSVGCYGLRQAIIPPIRYSSVVAPVHAAASAPAGFTLQYAQTTPIGLHRSSRFEKLKASAAAGAADSGSQPEEVAVPPKKLDHRKLGVLGLMFFISCFNYTILQSLKDALVVTEIGAEALPFLGAYGVFPGSIIFFMYYSWVAKDVYPALGMVANIGLIGAGAWIKFVNGSFSAHAKGEAEAAAIKRKGTKGKKDPGALTRAFDVLKQSPKVGNLAVLVIAYFVVAKLFDFAWKAQLRVFYPSNTEFQSALAGVSQLTGIATIAMMATSKFLFQYLGWGGAAIIPPLAILASGGLFFTSAIIANFPELVGGNMAAMIIPIGAAAGIAGRVLSKASKYSIFDPAKEMVFITMGKTEKNEGKAAVDLLGSYFGKSGASIMMQVMILVFGSLNSSMPVILGIHVVVCIAWTKSTASLATLMKKEEDAIAAGTSVAKAVPVEEAKDGDEAEPPIKSVDVTKVSKEDWGLSSKVGVLPIVGAAVSMDELDALKAISEPAGSLVAKKCRILEAEKRALESTFSDDDSY
eukprot:gene1454-32830_t